MDVKKGFPGNSLCEVFQGTKSCKPTRYTRRLKNDKCVSFKAQLVLVKKIEKNEIYSNLDKTLSKVFLHNFQALNRS